MKGLSVALIGADGSGKTTVGRALERTLPVPTRYLYMGLNAEASNVLLPTTRLVLAWKRARGANARAEGTPAAPPSATRSWPRRARSAVRSTLGLLNRLGEEWFRQGLAWVHLRRGRIVIFDRHFYSDFYAHDIASPGKRSLRRVIHGFVLKHLYPKPDLLVLLDAPTSVLWQRKPEGTKDALARRREEYLLLPENGVPLAIVDAAQPEETVVREVAQLVLDRYHARAGSPAPHRPNSGGA